MYRLALLGLILSIACGLAAGAHADQTPATIVRPECMTLVGQNGSTADPAGYFEITVLDGSNAPIPNARVRIAFSDSGVVIGSPQVYPGVGVDQCNPPAVFAFTDAAGVARFVVTGALADPKSPPPQPTNRRTADVSVSVGSNPPVSFPAAMYVRIVDLDGINGVTPNDLFLYLGCMHKMACSPLLFCPYNQRIDYGCTLNSTLVPNNSAFINAFMTSASVETPARCDGGANQRPPQLVSGGDLELAWGSCRAAGGSASATNACDASSSPTLVASLVAPAGATSVTGFEAEVEVVGDAGSPLPDFWRVDPGGCGTGITIGPPTSSGSCAVAAGYVLATGVYPAPGAEPNEELIRLWGVVTSAVGDNGTSQPLSLTSGHQYSLFTIQANADSTGPCGGCTRPVALELRSVRLVQGSCAGAATDLLMTRSSSDPAAIAFWQGMPAGFQITGVTPTNATAMWLAAPRPNPTRGETSIRFSLAHAGSVALAVYDAFGRRVRELARGTMSAGEHVATWDGADDRGRPARAGVFYVRLTGAERPLSRALVRIE